MQQRYPAPYGERMSPNQLCNVPVPGRPSLLPAAVPSTLAASPCQGCDGWSCSLLFPQNSSLLGHPFPHSVSPVLTHLQRAQLLGGAQVSPRLLPSSPLWWASWNPLHTPPGASPVLAVATSPFLPPSGLINALSTLPGRPNVSQPVRPSLRPRGEPAALGQPQAAAGQSGADDVSSRRLSCLLRGCPSSAAPIAAAAPAGPRFPPAGLEVGAASPFPRGQAPAPCSPRALGSPQAPAADVPAGHDPPAPPAPPAPAPAAAAEPKVSSEGGQEHGERGCPALGGHPPCSGEPHAAGASLCTALCPFL